MTKIYVDLPTQPNPTHAPAQIFSPLLLFIDTRTPKHLGSLERKNMKMECKRAGVVLGVSLSKHETPRQTANLASWTFESNC